jgi:hypothetical protein
VQNDKIVRALKKLSVTDPDKTLIIKIVSAFVALGVNPQAKSSSWLARRLKITCRLSGSYERQRRLRLKNQQPSNRKRWLNLKPRPPRKLRKKSNTGISAGIRVVIANRALVHDSQANREAVDGDSSRSPQDWSGC